jgi:hypothetical protein
MGYIKDKPQKVIDDLQDWLANKLDDIVYITKVDHIYNIYRREQKIGSFRFKPMSGQCGIAILYKIKFEDEYNSKENIKQIHSSGIALANELGYTQLFVTYDQDNQPEHLRQAQSLKFKLISQFRNKRTDNKIVVMCYNVEV